MLFFRLKDTFGEMTEKLQSELKSLRIENTKLITENQKMKHVLQKYEKS